MSLIAALVVAVLLLLSAVGYLYFFFDGPLPKPKAARVQVKSVQDVAANWFPGVNFSPEPPLWIPTPPVPALVTPAVPDPPLRFDDYLEDLDVRQGVEALHRGRNREVCREVEKLIMRVRLGAERGAIVDDLLDVHRLLNTIGGKR